MATRKVLGDDGGQAVARDRHPEIPQLVDFDSWMSQIN
jgi:hypothetical protein